MCLRHILSTTRFLGSKADGKEDKGNSFHSSNLNLLGRDLRSSQITLQTIKYLRSFIFPRFNFMFFGLGKHSVMP